ncbi:MAG: MFS transporter [Promethearchaeota archaeon]
MNDNNNMVDNEVPRLKKDKYIIFFSFYGFFKNLKFFEPYLLLIFINSGLSLFQVGILFSVMSIVSLVMEIPSGYVADNFGRKNAMLICFSFYIGSFFFFFLEGFWLWFVAIVLFGLGEAFRTGTHKAIIFEYLEHKNWVKHKTRVYGMTRSVALVGSSISSIVSILFILYLPADKFIFLITIIPYMIDFILVSSYPSFTNKKIKREPRLKQEKTGKKLSFLKQHSSQISTLLNSSFFDSVYKVIKDYIQPILALLILSFSTTLIPGLDPEGTLKLLLGVTYSMFYIIGSIASRNAHKLVQKVGSRVRVNDYMFIITGSIFFLISFFFMQNMIILIIILYFLYYIIINLRRPFVLVTVEESIPKSLRATLLSVESQLKELFVIFFAPLFGFIADVFGIPILFLTIAAVLIIFNFIFRLRSS